MELLDPLLNGFNFGGKYVAGWRVLLLGFLGVFVVVTGYAFAARVQALLGGHTGLD